MREILFRGKRVDTGEWVYGNYVQKIDPTKVEPTFWCCFVHDMALSMYEVTKETIGQFIGLSDKNGKKIFEGDICNFKYDKTVRTEPVCYLDAAFTLGSCIGLRESQTDYYIKIRSSLEIVGNIYDNPELLKL